MIDLRCVRQCGACIGWWAPGAGRDMLRSRFLLRQPISSASKLPQKPSAWIRLDMISSEVTGKQDKDKQLVLADLAYAMSDVQRDPMQSVIHYRMLMCSEGACASWTLVSTSHHLLRCHISSF